MYLRNFLSLIHPLSTSENISIRKLTYIISANVNYISSKNYLLTMGCTSSKSSSNNVNNKAESTAAGSNQYVEGVVCRDEDIKENEMKSYDLEDVGKVLLVRQKGQLSAIGAKCTHYGAPLANGALGDGRVRCPWHGACFNILNGDIEDFPGLDSLPCYQVTVENGDVKVRARRTELETNKRVKTMARNNPKESQRIIVIGGGPSGAACVEALRQEGFEGQITFVCKEPHLPYDRVKVSKAMDFEITKAEFRDDNFYRTHEIEVLKGVAAQSVNTTQHIVSLSNGQNLNYNKLYIATGLSAPKAPVPGADLQNIVTLREYADSHYTNSVLSEDIEVVVLGSSFIAMEAAFYCVNKVKKVTAVLRSKLPFQPLLGERIGEACLKLFKEKGVHFITKSGIKECIGDDSNKVKEVRLIDDSIIKADLVIMGVGGTCNTQFLANSGIELRPDGTIEVNDYLQSNVSDVYVGGDIAYAPVWSYHGRKSAIGHYPLAHYHGKMAALNMLDKPKKLEAVPYFWTMFFGKGIRFAGHGKYDDIIYVGNVEELKFAAFYLDGDEVVAASSCGMDPVVSQFAEILAQGKKLYRADVQGEEPLKWVERLHSN